MDRDQRSNHDLENRLRAERPRLSAIELDGLKQTVLSRVSTSPNRKTGFLKSRLALTFILATGVLMSGTGATMAVTGIAGDGDASVSQYGGVQGDQQTGTDGTDTPSTTDGTDTPGSTNGNGDDGSGEVLGQQKQGQAPTSNGSGDTAGRQAQATVRANDQIAAGTDGRLPFTGLVVFPLLLGGIVLVLVGGLLRRRTA